MKNESRYLVARLTHLRRLDKARFTDNITTRTRTAGINRRDQNSKDTKSIKEESQKYYLHVAPDGDWWTGNEIFAAKHLQPDYVRSIPVPPDIVIDEYLENLEDDEQIKILQRIYDDKKLPDDIILPEIATKEGRS